MSPHLIRVAPPLLAAAACLGSLCGAGPTPKPAGDSALVKAKLKELRDVLGEVLKDQRHRCASGLGGLKDVVEAARRLRDVEVELAPARECGSKRWRPFARWLLR
jgi:hypothetical protein